MFDHLEMFRETPERKAQSERILSSVPPSDYIPKAGEYFRMRFATIADRSWMGCVFKCMAFQNGAVLGQCVLGDSYTKEIPKLFVVGDVLFYEANEIGTALESCGLQDTGEHSHER